MASAAVEGRREERAPGRLMLFLAVLALAAASAGLLFWAIGDSVFAAAFLAGVGGAGAIVVAIPRRPSGDGESAIPSTDVALLRAALDSSGSAVAVT
ncbi:MAG TPA: hypothetical protein VF577_06605, partial [Allosphingosinicella sp.]